MSFWEDDLDIFFTDFATEIIWNGIAYKGIFHNAYEAATLFGQDIESKDPFLEVKTSDFAALAHSDVLTVNDVNYNPTSIEPDGTGISLIRLCKAA